MATDIIARGMATEAEKTANKYKAGANIIFTENADGTVAIEASGKVSSEDTVARNLINNHKENTDNPHGVTAEQIGLGNVDNTSDLEKPISNAMQEALDKKVDKSNLGTAAYKDVPTDGNASDGQVVLGNDSRLSDSRKADGGNADTLDGLHASDIQIDSVSDTAGLVTLDGLQGGVPFSDITVSGKNLITEVLSAALGGNSTDGFRMTNNPYCRSFVRKLLPNTTYTVKRYDGGNKFRIILFNEYPTITADTTANQILNATTTPNKWTFTTGSDHLWFALTTHNGATDKTIVEPIVQLEYGDTATEYEEPIIGQEITLMVNDTEYTVTPDSNPYTVPNDIRQQEGINSVSVSAGEVSVTGVKKNTAIKKIWDNKADLSDIPTKLPADGGDAATVNNKKINGNIYTSPVQFGKTVNDTADDIWKALPDSSIFMVGCSLFTNTSWAFPSDTVTSTLVILKLTEKCTGGIYLYPKTATGNIYYATLDDDGNFKSIWYKINDGGNSATLESHPASDFVLKADYDALAARVAALEGGTT